MTSSSEGLDSDAIFVIVAIICACAIGSNILVIVLVLLNKTVKTVTEIFICNLAVSDLILAGFAIPLKLNQATETHGHFTGGKLYRYLPL